MKKLLSKLIWKRRDVLSIKDFIGALLIACLTGALAVWMIQVIGFSMELSIVCGFIVLFAERQRLMEWE